MKIPRARSPFLSAETELQRSVVVRGPRAMMVILIYTFLPACTIDAFLLNFMPEEDVYESFTSFEVVIGGALEQAVAEHGPLAVFATLENAAGIPAELERVPIAWVCPGQERVLNRTTWFESNVVTRPNGSQDGTPSTLPLPLQSQGDWHPAGMLPDPPAVLIHQTGGCAGETTLGLVVETAPQAQHTSEAVCGDDAFGNSFVIYDHFFAPEPAVSEEYLNGEEPINIEARGERLFISAQTVSAPEHCVSRHDPFALETVPETIVLDLTEQGLTFVE